jgi:integrase/recombinase XerC
VRAYHTAARRLIEALPPGQDWASIARLDAARLRQHLAVRREQGLVNTSAARELPPCARSSPLPARAQAFPKALPACAGRA